MLKNNISMQKLLSVGYRRVEKMNASQTVLVLQNKSSFVAILSVKARSIYLQTDQKLNSYYW